MRTVTGVVLVVAGVSIGAYASSPEKDNAPRASLYRSLADAKPHLSVDITEVSLPTPVATPEYVVQAISISQAPPRVPVVLHPSSSRTSRVDVRDVQHQLRRVGCYRGDIDGVWSASTIRSMKAFTDYVNAVLPLEHPDIALLALLENNRGGACGAGRHVSPASTYDRRRLPSVPGDRSLADSTSDAAKRVSKAAREGPRNVKVALVRERRPQRTLKGGNTHASWAARAFHVIH